MTQPNDDIASQSSLAGQLNHVLRRMLMECDDMLPAKVVSYDDATNRASIQPLVMIGTTDGQKISRAVLPEIPVFRFGGGGFFIRMPLKPGDFGWLKANDRDISLVFQRGGLEDWPNTERVHSFSDAMFFPDALKDWIIDDQHRDALVIQSLNGAVCLALHGDSAVLRAPSVTLDAEKTVCRGNLSVQGSLTVDGEGKFGGTALRHNGKNVGATHQHSGVEPGPGLSGVPL